MSNALIYLLKNIAKHKLKIPMDKTLLGTDYDDDELDNYRLAVILLHAELEVYFEDLASEIITQSVSNNFFKKRFIDYPLSNLMFKIHKKLVVKDDVTNDLNKKINSYISQISDYFVKEIVDWNNGINKDKLKNIYDLLGMHFIFESTLYQELNSRFLKLTELRTQYVHKKYEKRFIANAITPKLLIDIISFIEDKISELDKMIIEVANIGFDEVNRLTWEDFK